jgi:hypothetical protein
MEVQMRKRLKRGVLCCALSILALALAGCDVEWLTVLVPDFQTKQVQGVWISRSTSISGTYTHAMQVPVQAPGSGPLFQDVPDSGGVQQSVVVLSQPDSTNPSAATVKIGVFAPRIPGYVRVSTYNTDGESPMSSADAAL